MSFDIERLLALNNAHATELSWLDQTRLATLIERAFFVRALGEDEAFLLAFDQDADYDSPNFLWFRARHERFVYVDRIVVAAAARVAAPGGWVIASSNLGSVSPRQFQGALVDGLRKAGCHARVLHTGGQAADFAAALHVPEGSFLKFVVLAVHRA